ncbi:MAG: DUF975 family protein [Erysipelotrichia bacterium]|nr:DUF975 family protein [Erysipelotrichia bacterium]
MMDRMTLKEYAKQKVQGKRVEIWKALIFTFLGSMVVSFFLPAIDTDALNTNYNVPSVFIDFMRTTLIASLISTFLLQPLTYGVNQYLMDFDKDKHENDTIFASYKSIIKIFVLTVFIGIVTQCFSLIGVALTIIFLLMNLNDLALNLALPLIFIGSFASLYLSYCFRAVPYIFNENKEKSIMEIMALSNKMMKGHKFDFFILELSFIGWFIIGTFTCGIAFIWILPYFSFTLAKYFLDLKESFYGITTDAVDAEVIEEEDSSTIH